MHKLSKILHRKVGFTAEASAEEILPNVSREFLAEQELYRYRKQRGVNLGTHSVGKQYRI
jgi:hypothetical protein